MTIQCTIGDLYLLGRERERERVKNEVVKASKGNEFLSTVCKSLENDLNFLW